MDNARRLRTARYRMMLKAVDTFATRRGWMVAPNGITPGTLDEVAEQAATEGGMAVRTYREPQIVFMPGECRGCATRNPAEVVLIMSTGKFGEDAITLGLSINGMELAYAVGHEMEPRLDMLAEPKCPGSSRLARAICDLDDAMEGQLTVASGYDPNRHGDGERNPYRDGAAMVRHALCRRAALREQDAARVKVSAYDA
jgi:hypothetical protein